MILDAVTEIPGVVYGIVMTNINYIFDDRSPKKYLVRKTRRIIMFDFHLTISQRRA